jgi:hypothetical protein
VKTTNPVAPAALRRTTSRTRTAPTALNPTVYSLHGSPFDVLYAGPPTIPAIAPAYPGLQVSYPTAPPAIQVFATTASTTASVALILDLGRNVDVARIELYGNPLLPAFYGDDGRPVFNFGLPRAIGVAIGEDLWLNRTGTSCASTTCGTSRPKDSASG